MWGCDWTKLLINHIRWYLIILIDFFFRFIIGYDIHLSINTSHAKHRYVMGLKHQGIPYTGILPELRTDRGSPNTSWVTKEFFALMGADLSYARGHTGPPIMPSRSDSSAPSNRRRSTSSAATR